MGDVEAGAEAAAEADAIGDGLGFTGALGEAVGVAPPQAVVTTSIGTSNDRFQLTIIGGLWAGVEASEVDLAILDPEATITDPVTVRLDFCQMSL